MCAQFVQQDRPAFAAEREWAFPGFVELARFDALWTAWQRSRSLLTEARSRLARAMPPFEVETVVVFGSLGRMEALPQSDLDLSIVLRDDVNPTEDEARRLYDAVWAPLEPLGFDRPQADGIFAEPTRGVILCDPSRRGRIDEEPAVFGKRMQLLLDAQPLLDDDAFERLIERVLRWYGFGTRQPAPYDEWSFLLADLQRYHASLAARYQWGDRDRPGTWRMLNAKFRFSRLLNHAGLSTLLGECSRVEGDRLAWLARHLKLVPLERLALVYDCAGRAGFDTIAGAYDLFLDHMGDAAARARLEDDAVPVDAPHAGFDELVEASQRLAGEFRTFVESRRVWWSERFPRGPFV